MAKGNNDVLFAVLFLLAVLAAVWLFWPRASAPAGLSESKAIELIKESYPELRDYPSDSFPPRSIAAEKDPLGWRISFIQEGSGRPVLGAKCFLVKDANGSGSVTLLGNLSNVSAGSEESSLAACKAGCMVQECHGLGVSCGTNAPDVCTEVYELGDRCRAFAICEIVDGKCVVSAGQEFKDCKSCVEKCEQAHGTDPTELFSCEGRC